ncbi:MAG TPA: hypothetical protein VMW23_02635 [Sedimentisphaerales bacterium]|nr:hypothetical protein [Sedimentisphaerales bacterium]
MSFNNICRNFACGMGKVIGGGFSLFGSAQKAVRQSTVKFHPRRQPKKTEQSLTTQELMRLVHQEAELTQTKLEHRLQIMAETIQALEKKITPLSAAGPVTEADMWQAMACLKGAQSLTSDEKALLASVFRDNIAIQKPELVAAGDESAGA